MLTLFAPLLQAGPPGSAKEAALPYYVVFPRHSYQREAHWIGEVNFGNFPVDIYGPDAKQIYLSATLTNGRWQVSQTHPFPSEDQVVLLEVRYFDFSPGMSHAGNDSWGARYALTVLGWEATAATGSGYGIVNLYRVIHGRVQLLEQINFDADTSSAAVFEPNTRKLTITATDYGPAGPNCCPSNLDIVTFKWTGSSFLAQSSKLVPYPKSNFYPW